MEPVFDLAAWRKEHPDSSFHDVLEDHVNWLNENLPELSLGQIEYWQGHYEQEQECLFRYFPELKGFSSLEPGRNEEQEWAVCERFLPLLRREIERRNGGDQPVMRKEPPAAHEILIPNDSCCKQACLLKNSLPKNPQKLKRVKKLHERFFRFA